MAIANKIFTHSLALLSLLSLSSVMAANDTVTHPVFDGERVTERPDYAPNYIVGMHNLMPSEIKERYEENGIYYYNKYGINSFGLQEPLNVDIEMIVCENGEESFQSALSVMAEAAAAEGRSYTESCLGEQCLERVGVGNDATSMPLTTDIFYNTVSAILQGSNATNNARGRFCYDEDNNSGSMNYRDPQAAFETYCEAGQDMPLYQDPISGFTCQIRLDIPLKVGKTRFVRQAQPNAPTIGQGFISCSTNEATGNAVAELVGNPETCENNREDCIRTCDWADNVVCTSDTMPRWGGPDGQRCGALATTIFKGDAITVNSSGQLSYSEAEGVIYEGSATMSCAMVSGQAQWIISGSSCAPQALP